MGLIFDKRIQARNEDVLQLADLFTISRAAIVKKITKSHGIHRLSVFNIFN